MNFFTGKLRFIITIALVLQGPIGCVTGGGSAGGDAIVGVALVSAIANRASQGERKSLSIWCRVLKVVEKDSEDPRLNELVYEQGIAAGFRLHQVQVEALTGDAKKVLASEEARSHHLSKCSQSNQQD